MYSVVYCCSLLVTGNISRGKWGVHSSSCLYIGSPKSYSFISDPSEFLLTSIAFATVHQSRDWSLWAKLNLCLWNQGSCPSIYCTLVLISLEIVQSHAYTPPVFHKSAGSICWVCQTVQHLGHSLGLGDIHSLQRRGLCWLKGGGDYCTQILPLEASLPNIQRYISIHLLLFSTCPCVWGWYAVENCGSIPSSL